MIPCSSAQEGTFFSQELEVVMSLEASNSTEPLILASDSAADDLDPILAKTQRFKVGGPTCTF